MREVPFNPKYEEIISPESELEDLELDFAPAEEVELTQENLDLLIQITFTLNLE